MIKSTCGLKKVTKRNDRLENSGSLVLQPLSVPPLSSVN